jgi:hypothetical protein
MHTIKIIIFDPESLSYFAFDENGAEINAIGACEDALQFLAGENCLAVPDILVRFRLRLQFLFAGQERVRFEAVLRGGLCRLRTGERVTRQERRRRGFQRQMGFFD